MTDDTRDLSAYPKPGTAEVGILKFGGAGPEIRPALNRNNPRLTKAVEIPPTQERIAAALERIAAALEARSRDDDDT